MPNQRLGDKQHSFTVEMKVWKIENVWFNCIFLKKISPLVIPALLSLSFGFFTPSKTRDDDCCATVSWLGESRSPNLFFVMKETLACKTHYFDISCAQSNGDLFFSFSFFMVLDKSAGLKHLFPSAKHFCVKIFFFCKKCKKEALIS